MLLGLLGGVVSGGAQSWLLTLAGTGFCGALTTFSTFGFETLRLVEEGSVLEAFLNTGGSLLIGFVACAGGWVLAAGLA